MIIKSITELHTLAQSFLDGLSDRSDNVSNGSNANIIGLRGELGAGKTAFVKEVAKILGIDLHITSPTFVIAKKYDISYKGFSKLIHIDAYRLKDDKELSTIGWQEMIKDPKNLIMIEWPEIVTDGMPADILYIDFKHVDETTREINI